MFFVKQKTAYEMRISDWSSDVCSSDLRRSPAPCARHGHGDRGDVARRPATPHLPHRASRFRRDDRRTGDRRWREPAALLSEPRYHRRARVDDIAVQIGRSEEHTSELQSLMRNSYAVFCLKKKKTSSYTQTIMTPSKYKPN